MKKGAILTIAVSTFLIILSFIIFIAGSLILDRDLSDESIFRGDSGEVFVRYHDTYSVYVSDTYSCSETTVSIHDDEWEYFFEDCDFSYVEGDWRYIGYLNPDVSKSLQVESNNEIIIVNDLADASIIFTTLCSLPVCCSGIIGILIGILLLTRRDKKRKQEIIFQ